MSSDLMRCAARRTRRSSFGANIGAAAEEATTASGPGRSHLTLRNLYSGVSAPLVTVGAVQSVNFALYDSMRRKLHERRCGGGVGRSDYRGPESSLLDVSLASFLSGGIVSAITGPLVALKVRQQVTGCGLGRALSDAVARGGCGGRDSGSMRGLYRGYSVHFVCDAVGRAVFFPCYEGLKREISIRRRGPGSVAEEVTTPERMAAAAASGVVSCSVVHPFDAVRTRIYGSGLSVRAQSTLEVAGEMWRANGARAFTRGFGVAAARGGPVSAVAMPVYDIALDYFNGREGDII